MISRVDTSPRLYVGTVGHARLRPRRNAFRYGIYFVYTNIDSLDSIQRSTRLFSRGGSRLFSLHDVDHGPRDGSPLRPWIEAVLAGAGIETEGGPVMLLAFPRVLGGRFFPVSFWYCYHADGTIRAILAEVNNTFKEHHNYLLHDGGAPLRWGHPLHATKVFYVSPFIAMDARYEFGFSEPDERLSVSLLDVVEGELLLTTRLALERRPLNDTEILGAFLRYGPVSSRAWLFIRWQAIRLVARGIRYVRRPSPPLEETT